MLVVYDCGGRFDERMKVLPILNEKPLVLSELLGLQDEESALVPLRQFLDQLELCNLAEYESLCSPQNMYIGNKIR